MEGVQGEPSHARDVACKMPHPTHGGSWVQKKRDAKRGPCRERMGIVEPMRTQTALFQGLPEWFFEIPGRSRQERGRLDRQDSGPLPASTTELCFLSL